MFGKNTRRQGKVDDFGDDSNMKGSALFNKRSRNRIKVTVGNRRLRQKFRDVFCSGRMKGRKNQ
jgi:hypothetical protein